MESAALPLFCAGVEPSYKNEVLTLFAYSAVGSGIIASLHLFVPDSSGFNSTIAYLTLHASGSPVPVTAALDLHARGEANRLGLALNLYAGNQGTDAALNLFASGAGNTPGATPYSDSMALYLHRPLADALPLYCLAPGYPVSGYLSLFANANQAISGHLQLSVPYVSAAHTIGLDLYAGGI